MIVYEVSDGEYSYYYPNKKEAFAEARRASIKVAVFDSLSYDDPEQKFVDGTSTVRRCVVTEITKDLICRLLGDGDGHWCVEEETIAFFRNGRKVNSNRWKE